MYWLRRIPAETRIVVLLVFLALFQAILLSVFGLVAVRGERRQVAEQMQQDALAFLREVVVAPCENGLRDRADEVFFTAFANANPDWRDAPEGVPGGGLFLDAFQVDDEGAVRTEAGLPLLLPPRRIEAEAAAARAEAARLGEEYARGLLDDPAKERGDLAFARRYPFLRDELGASVSLVFAATPLLHADGGAPDAETLLAIRWVGVLNRLAGLVAPAEVDAFLARVDGAGAGDARFAAGRAEQDRREAVLRALERELPHLSRAGAPRFHANQRTGAAFPFYVRPVGDAVQVLSADAERLQAYLDEVERRSADAARTGVEPRILQDRRDAPFPSVPMHALPGHYAFAEVSPAVVRSRAAGRERIYWWIIGFSIAGILAGGFLTARVVMREVKLAKLKSGFVSNVSHELKTPLTSIRMFTDMLRDGSITDEKEQGECLDVISQETARLGRLIQQVLDFGRLEARKRRFRWATASLAPLVAKEAARFRRTTGLSEEEFAVHLATNTPPVAHDPDAFPEVVSNLLSNAYKYSPKDGRRIALFLGPRQGRVVLEVADNGPGVPRRERKKIFEQFYRAGDLLTSEVEGTGLGLSIARGIVQAHGGRILVEDRDGGGSRFLVVLRAARAPAPPQTPARQPEPTA